MFELTVTLKNQQRHCYFTKFTINPNMNFHGTKMSHHLEAISFFLSFFNDVKIFKNVLHRHKKVGQQFKCVWCQNRREKNQHKTQKSCIHMVLISNFVFDNIFQSLRTHWFHKIASKLWSPALDSCLSMFPSLWHIVLLAHSNGELSQLPTIWI